MLQGIKYNHAPGLVYEHLDQFRGVWKTKGEIYENPIMPAGKIIGTDKYEWLSGGFFLIHYVNVKMGKTKVKSIEIISYDHVSNTYLMNSFDSQGNHTIMHAEYNTGSWIFRGGAMKFTGSFSNDLKSINGIWEYHENLVWKKWMDITLTRKDNIH